MTRFSTVAGFVAAVGWLVANTGCEAALMQGSSSATAAMVEEQRSLHVALASITQVDQAGRKNLRPAAMNKDKKEDGETEAVRPGGGGARAGKPLEALSMQNKRMTQERTVDWARQLGVSQKDVDQLVKAYNAKEDNMAARARFLSKRHTDEVENHVKGQRKLANHSDKAFKTPASSSSLSQSFFDAMRNKSYGSSSNRAASSTSNISPSQKQDGLRKTEESVINDSCSDSNPTLVVGGAMVTGSLEGAQNYTVESCAAPSVNVGLWCKCNPLSLVGRHYKPRIYTIISHLTPQSCFWTLNDRKSDCRQVCWSGRRCDAFHLFG
jgi:hypothetical protein